jgi:hypothetical protein
MMLRNSGTHAFCLYIGWIFGDHLLLMDFVSREILMMFVIVTVVMEMLLRKSGTYL